MSVADAGFFGFIAWFFKYSGYRAEVFLMNGM
jgi:hypothetical protein